jgi:hypothetical protein
MKRKLLLYTFFTTVIAYSQPATDVYLFDIIQNDSVFTIDNPLNISNNVGYDNQPSFLKDGSGVLFTSTRFDQTDIVLYDIKTKLKSWLTNTISNEYSPIQSPNKKYFTAIRLEKDGTQLLWVYPFSRKKPKVLLENLAVGYHVWYNKRIVVSFVLGDPATLEVSNLKYKIKYPIEKNIGRSILKIPNSNSISYISLEENEPEIYSINPLNSEKKYIADALKGSQDLAWTPNGLIIMGKENKLYKLEPGTDVKWVPFASLEPYNLTGITRIAISPYGDKIAIVVNENDILNNDQ